MANILISLLLVPQGPLGEAFARLAGALRSRGHTVTLWGPAPLAGDAENWLPLYWPLHQTVRELGARFSACAAPDTIDDATWTTRLAATGFQGIRVDEVGGLEVAYRDLCAGLLETLKPDLFVAWNPYTVHTGVPRDLALARGIRVLALERGIPANTLVLQRGGLFGDTPEADAEFDALIPPGDFAALAEAGRAHMEQVPIAAMLRYGAAAGATEGRIGQGLKIAFLATDDCSTGLIPPDHADRPLGFPFVRSSLEAAAMVAEACPDAQVMVKPHPSILHLTAKQELPANATLTDTAPDALIRDCDVVVSLGGSLVALALRMGKPVVALNRDFYSGKGITFDPGSPDDLVSSIMAAAASDAAERATRLQRYQALAAWMMRDGPLHGYDGTLTLVARIETALAEPAPGPAAASMPMVPSDASFRPVRASVQQVEDALSRLDGDRLLLLDFDHTLFAGNSTEIWLHTARPAFLVSPILAVVRGLVPWQRFAGLSWYRIRDAAAVLLICLLLPWNILLWRRRAPAIFRAGCDHAVARAVAAVPVERTVIISFGLDFILKAMLKGSPWESARRIATPSPPPLRPFLRALRRGKQALAEAHLTARQIATSVLVTDSEHDRDLLDRVGTPLLVAPAGDMSPAEIGLYFPLRYTAHAKYNLSYVLTQSLFIEFPLILLMYLPEHSFSVLFLISVCAFYISTICIYEIGYFENDQKAAANEANPTLKPEAQAWSGFPLERHAWAWGIAAGAIGCILVGPLEFFWSTFAIWMAGLICIRVLFYLYNRARNRGRTIIYPFLQISKFFIISSIFQSSLIGAIAMTSHVMAMWINYIIYRSGGNKFFFYRDEARPIIFLVIYISMFFVSAINIDVNNLYITIIAIIILFSQQIHGRIIWNFKKITKRIGRRLLFRSG